MENFAIKLSFLVFILCVLISLRNPKATNKTQKISIRNNEEDDFYGINYDFTLTEASSSPSTTNRNLLLEEEEDDEEDENERLRYDYYSDTCPSAERIVRSHVREEYVTRPEIAPALLRLVFHDCFVQGCDASILLDDADGIKNEKTANPNLSLKFYDVIDDIKSKLEDECPGVVSCSDIVVLAARESVLLAGGPFYPLYTGRKDSMDASFEKANDLPAPTNNLTEALQKFSTLGFSAREMVALLGAHSTGRIHCEFLNERLHNFNATNDADPSMDPKFLEHLRSKCNQTHPPSSAPSSSPCLSPSPSSSSPAAADNNDPGFKMDYEGPRTNFGTLYYRSLLQARGLLFVDQQLTSGEETMKWVQTYASDVLLFQEDFGRTMIKLSNLNALTAPKGQVRLNCRKLN